MYTTSSSPFGEEKVAKEDKEMKKKIERGKGEGCHKLLGFSWEFHHFWGIFMGIWPFSNSQNSQLFLGIPQKLLGFSPIPHDEAGDDEEEIDDHISPEKNNQIDCIINS